MVLDKTVDLNVIQKWSIITILTTTTTTITCSSRISTVQFVQQRFHGEQFCSGGDSVAVVGATRTQRPGADNYHVFLVPHDFVDGFW